LLEHTYRILEVRDGEVLRNFWLTRFAKNAISRYIYDMKEIVQATSPVLRETARAVSLSAIGSEHIAGIIADMTAAMASQKDGIAIAAPQIGQAIRLFVVSDRLLSVADKTYKSTGHDLVFINPELVKASREKKEVEEGCLSVRWYYGKVKRSTKVTIRAYNEKGEKVERGARGLLAQIFQHECDHLNGILFTDKAKEIWEMTDEEKKEMMDNNQ
jgi:peptide deformylase